MAENTRDEGVRAFESAADQATASFDKARGRTRETARSAVASMAVPTGLTLVLDCWPWTGDSLRR